MNHYSFPIEMRYHRDNLPPGDLDIILRDALRTWMGCRITFRYSYWKKDQWSWESPIDTRIVDHIVDRSYNVEEFILYLRSHLHIVSPN